MFSERCFVQQQLIVLSSMKPGREGNARDNIQSFSLSEGDDSREFGALHCITLHRVVLRIIAFRTSQAIGTCTCTVQYIAA